MAGRFTGVLLLLQLATVSRNTPVLQYPAPHSGHLNNNAVQLQLQQALLQAEGTSTRTLNAVQPSPQTLTHDTGEVTVSSRALHSVLYYDQGSSCALCDPRHVRDAEEWRMAAEQGSAWGQTHLGYCYIAGELRRAGCVTLS